MVQTVKAEREKLERRLEALKKAQREAETAYRRLCVENIEEAFQALPEDQKKAATAEFQLGLGSYIYVDAFKKAGWKDRLNAVAIREFWSARSVSFPSPADWAQKNSSLEPDVIKAQIEELEAELKKPVVSVKPI